ncbi:DUF378 domain-containing protein [Coxiella endosymbiont of Ornithodoros amblus]|uniref:DUF378 domain-containing protein n=1 Tax=Coxiella endosymbiont of Ornithodoros amblus TaxID=1656166 RepID=UPI00244E3D9F|nr:DUF378 domain-containing protein [Coxiella endosymbiont of Ornithodoros amblus]MBW5802878.1 DUF378 domain-containing protein [Coxiella endosymbiont of Ornithodoros amblus]
MKNLSVIDWIAVILLIIRGLNIGFMGVFDYNILGGIFSQVTALLQTIYLLIDLTALWFIFHLTKKQ